MYPQAITMCSLVTFVFLCLVCNHNFLNKAEAHEVSTNLTYGRIRLYYFNSQFLGSAHDYAAPPDMLLESNCQRIGIRSPSISSENDYGFNIFCFWKITAPKHYQVALTFQSFEIGNNNNCTLNYLEIRNGHSSKSPSLGKYCSTSTPDDVYSSDEQMSIELSLKSLTSKTGFSLKFFKMPCEKVVNASSGVITSPSFPDRYPPNKHCTWEVIVPPRHYVVLNFTDFDLGNFNGTCESDNLTLRNKMDDNATQEYEMFCGSRIPESYIFNETFQIEFNSGSSTANRSGFSASFTMGENECLTDNGKCQHFCDDTFDGYICSCKDGYTLGKNQHDCEDIDECITDNGGCEQLCNNVDGSYVCSCENGYFLHENLHNCTDDDECSSNIGDCPQLCNNTIGSYFCSCKDGYVIHENMRNCTDINECTTDNGGCQQMCHNTVGSYICSCFAGYQFHEDRCEDKNECTNNNGGCQYMCHNTIGSYFCSCEPGFHLHENEHDCVDFDECQTDNGGCQQICNNVPGSYHCSCFKSFPLEADGRTCKDECSYIITSKNGTVTSPGYPDLYPLNMTCTWHWIVTPGHRIQVWFNEFELEYNDDCSYDMLKIYDGGSTSSYSKGTFCGISVPESIWSSSNEMYLLFSSDISKQGRGFKLEYMAVCGGYFVADSNPAYLYSHMDFSDAHYEKYQDCQWSIRSSHPSQRIHLRFLVFELESSSACKFDYLKIVDNPDSWWNRKSEKYCGKHEEPWHYVSSSNELFLHFKSDQSVQDKGFKIQYFSE